MTKRYVIPKVGVVTDLEASIKIVMPKAGVVVQFPTVAGGTHPVNPLGHPLKGPLGGPLG